MSSCEIIEGITLHHGDCRDIREWEDKVTATRMCSHKVYGAGGSYPPNLMVSDAALAAAVDQGAPDNGWPVFRYQPKAPTHERPKVGGYSMRP